MKHFTLLMSLFISSQCFGQWQEFYKTTNNNFYKVETNGERLFIGAEYADIHRQSTGANFDSKSLQGYGFIGDIEFVDENIGFASSGCYYTTSDCPANTIYKTIDGGLTWVMIAQFGSTGVVTGLEVINENKIFAQSEYEGLNYSEDGGMTWTTMVIDNEISFFFGLEFINEEIGFVIGKRRTSQGSYSVVFKTIDGGQTWNEIYEAAKYGVDFWDYCFVSETTAFLTSNDGIIRQTTDGGVSWNNINISNNTAEEGRKIEFITPQVGYLGTFDAENQKGYLYRTQNGGYNWTLELTTDSSTIFDFTFLDTENGYAIANYRTIYKRTKAVQPIENTLELVLAPNPTNDFFTLSNTVLPIGNYQLSVFDAAGKRILSTSDIYKRFATESWTPGIYFVEIRNEESQLVRRGKLVKQD